MVTLFYVILVIFSEQVTWSWWWFLIALIFDTIIAREKESIFNYVIEKAKEKIRFYEDLREAGETEEELEDIIDEVYDEF